MKSKKPGLIDRRGNDKGLRGHQIEKSERRESLMWRVEVRKQQENQSLF